VTREEGARLLRGLALGLKPDLEGARKLLERISVADDRELLTALLVERGAEVVLDEEMRP
jgi:hypothetical protein